jgi:hypothetical protein
MDTEAGESFAIASTSSISPDPRQPTAATNTTAAMRLLEQASTSNHPLRDIDPPAKMESSR